MVICNFLQVIPDTIWQLCSMIILLQLNFQVLLLVRPRTIRQNWWGVPVRCGKLSQVSIPQRWSGPKRQLPHDWSDKGFCWTHRNWVICRETGCSRQQAAVQCTKPDVKVLFSLGVSPLQGFPSGSLIQIKLLSIMVGKYWAQTHSVLKILQGNFEKMKVNYKKVDKSQHNLKDISFSCYLTDHVSTSDGITCLLVSSNENECF